MTLTSFIVTLTLFISMFSRRRLDLSRAASYSHSLWTSHTIRFTCPLMIQSNFDWHVISTELSLQFNSLLYTIITVDYNTQCVDWVPRQCLLYWTSRAMPACSLLLLHNVNSDYLMVSWAGVGQLSLPSLRGKQIKYWPYWLGLRRGLFACVSSIVWSLRGKRHP